ncbi:hypothetical protein AeRB84_007348, partial [Aphanomyces euteiches]
MPLARLLDLVGPVVLQNLVDSTGDMDQMYYWLGALLVAKFTRVIVWSHCIALGDTLGIRIISGLKGIVFQKLLCKASYTTDDIPDLANVYTADMNAILWATVIANNLWILPVQIFAISYLLYQQIGVATFAGMGMIILSFLVGSWISKNVSKASDQRMQAVKETFGSILVVKLQAWEEKSKNLGCSNNLTIDLELGYVWKLVSGVSVTSFAVYSVVMNQPLSTSKVFTSLALFRQLQDPVREIPGNITSFIQAQPKIPVSENLAVVIQNGTFTDVNLTIHRGDLVVIHGKVGSGKSSLCMAICGEMKQTQGTSGVYGSIAYCSQEPWIQQMSVRDNILFGKPFDSAKYTRVVDACGLLPDFELMAFGDMTEVGSKGRNLSGGQKAR